MNTLVRSSIASKFVAALWLMAISSAPAQNAVEAWVQRYGHPVDSSDFARKVVTDDAGNVIVAGDSYDGISQDYLIIKYSGTGTPLWTNRYDGPGNHTDEANALAVDGSGNVFVTGYSYGRVSGPDYATIKYSGAGVPLWTNRYSGDGYAGDFSTAIAVDGSGNVLVTGSSFGDYATIKYSGAGVPLWTNRYNGPGNSDDFSTAIAVDGSGNVLVTGFSGSGGAWDYSTIKYSSTGVPVWTNHYNGPGVSYDSSYAVAVDGSGNVFVTGSSGGAYATLAYSDAGVPLWTNRYNGPGNDNGAAALVVDGSGNVLVTGHSAGSGGAWDYSTIKYSGAGVPLWTNRYNGPGNGEDASTAIAVDGSGNVLVTGHSAGSGGAWDYSTIKYSGAGVPLWTNRYNGPGNGEDASTAIAVDGSGSVLVTGSSFGTGSRRDFATIKYSDTGAPLWTNRHNELGNNTDRATAIAVDSGGNVFVTGYSATWTNADTDLYIYDYATIKYSGTGVPLWTNRYNGPGNRDDYANAIAVDSSGNVVVTGWSFSGGADDYATIKYSGAGVPLWTNRYNGPGNDTDQANAIAVDGSGNVFVTGYSYGSGGVADYATIKYSGAGVPLWTNRYNGPGNSHARASALAVDGSGNVLVTGYSVGSGNGTFEYATIKYSGGGVPLWTNRYNGPGNYFDYARAVAVDSSGNVLVTGTSVGSGSGYDYATIKYSGAGVPLWTNRYNGPGNNTDQANAIAVDGSGNVLVTGYSYDAGSTNDYATIKYSGAGVPLWTNRYNGPGNRADAASVVAVDGSGNVLVTGYSEGSGGSFDYATIKYSGEGVPLWTNRYNGPANGNDSPGNNSCLAIGPDDAVYVTGSSQGNRGSYDYATIKYANPLLRLTIQSDGGGGYLLRIQGIATTYRLQRAPSVTGPWSSSPTQTMPASGVAELRDIFPPPGQGFYRAVQP